METKLYNELLVSYNPLARPVVNSSLPVVVTIGVVLQQIVDVNEKGQVIEVNAWLVYNWKDETLVWDPENYDGIKDVRFPSTKIWKPDVLLYNSADSTFDSTYHTNIIVYNDGSVNWIPPGIFKSSCKMDVTWFPFDDQTCNLKARFAYLLLKCVLFIYQFWPIWQFGSWSYHGFALDLIAESESIDVSEYLSNGEWILVSTPAERQVKTYTTAPEPYPSVTFSINIRRRSTYYILNAILPCILISMMTLLGFCLPPECGEKITIEMTVLLSICFFLSVIADMIPATSETTPLIATFFVSCMFMVSMSVVFTVIVLNLHHRSMEHTRLSGWPRQILLNFLPSLLRLKSPLSFPVRTAEDKYRNYVPRSWSVTRAMAVVRPEGVENEQLECNNSNYYSIHLTSNKVSKKDKNNMAAFHKEFQSIIQSLDGINDKMDIMSRRVERKEEEEMCMSEWHLAARAVDILCLLLFALFLLISTIASLIRVSMPR